MKKLLPLLLWLNLPLLSFSQSPPPDRAKIQEMLTQLAPEGQSPGADTVRVQNLYELGKLETNQDSAIRYYQSGLAISQRLQWEPGLLSGNYFLGYRYALKGYYFRACDYMFKALSLAEKRQDQAQEGKALRYLAGFHNLIGERESGLAYYKKAMVPLKAVKDWNTYLVCINNIGLVYYNLQDYNRAIAYFKRCLQLNDQFKYGDITNFCLTNLSASYIKIGKLDMALWYNRQLEEMHPTSADVIAYNDAQMARIYLLQGNQNEAFRRARKALASVDQVRRNTQEEIYDLLYTLYERKGDAKLALVYYKKWSETRLQDSADMREKPMEALRNEYRFEKQRAKDEREKAELNWQRNVWTGSAGFLFCFGSVLIIYNRVLSRRKRQIEEQRNTIIAVQEELVDVNGKLVGLNNSLEDRIRQRTEELTIVNDKLIRANHDIHEAFFNGQTIERKRVASELHDNLGSTLSALKWQLEALQGTNLYSNEQRVYESVMTKMEEAYSEVRLISHNLMPANLAQKGLEAAIEKLIDELNASGRIHFRYDAEYESGTFDKRVELELYSIALELINNVLKHSGATEAFVCLRQEEEGFLLRVADNGIGLDKQSPADGHGMGLTNLRNRVNALRGELTMDASPWYKTIVDVRLT